MSDMHVPCTDRAFSPPRAAQESMAHIERTARDEEVCRTEHASFDALFLQLASQFRTNGWEARQEVPPQAYLHVSKPNWGDETMNGIHFETYILSKQLAEKLTPVALHCERGCPFQEKFMRLFTESLSAAQQAGSWDPERRYTILGPEGSSVCETLLEFGETPGETMEKLASELRWLQENLGGMVDETITECLKEDPEKT